MGRSPRTPLLVRLLLGLFPAEFRREYGRDMVEELRRSLADAPDARSRRSIRRHAYADMAQGALREHWETWFGTDGRSWEMGGILNDAKRALRGLGRAPGFTVVVVLTLALGIGAATAIYSVAYGALMAPMPYPDSERLVNIGEAYGPDRQSVSVSPRNIQDWKEGQSTMEAIAVVRGGALTLTTAEGAEQVSTLFADPEFFRVFGARPAAGRFYGEEDNRVPSGHPVAVLSFDAWETRFGADPSVIGTAVNLSGVPYTILGVMSRDFRDPFGGQDGNGNDLFVPTMMAGQIDPRGDDVLTNRRFRSFGAVGLLRPGVSVGAAEADVDAIATRMSEEFADTNRGFGARVQDFAEVQTQGLRGPVLTLLAGAMVLLLIACFNVANLMLVRGATREQELSLQLALGAGRARLFRFLTVESFVLAILGGGLGTLAASAILPGLLGMIPNQLPPTADVGISLPVLAASFGLTLLAGAAFGLIPAMRVSGVDLRGAISGGGRSVGDRRGERIRNGLVLFEVATATVLLASSALLVRTFQELSAADSGFATEDILTVRMSLPAEAYPDADAMADGIRRLTERLDALPQVEWAQPWGPGRPGLVFNLQTSVPEGMEVAQLSDSPLARRHHVGPGTLEDMGITLLRGRGIESTDTRENPFVAVISESMANELWPGQDPLGRQFHAFTPPGAPIAPDRNWTVVGVVTDANHGGRVPPPGSIATDNDAYYPIAQRPERAFTMLVKSDGPVDVGPLREAVRAFDPNIPMFQVATVEQNFEQEEGSARFAAQLMAGFGGFALMLAALGVYGVISFSVSRRTREIGLRAALGAEPGHTLSRFVGFGLKLAVAGVVVGAGSAYGLAAGAQSLVPGVPQMDAVAVGIAAGALVIVAGVSCLLPAMRATRIDPVVALKGD